MFKIANRKKKKDQKILYLIPGRQKELLSLKMQLSDIDLQHSRFSRTCHLELNMGLRLELLVELVLVNQLLHRLYLGFWSWRKAQFLLTGSILVKLNFRN